MVSGHFGPPPVVERSILSCFLYVTTRESLFYGFTGLPFDSIKSKRQIFLSLGYVTVNINFEFPKKKHVMLLSSVRKDGQNLFGKIPSRYQWDSEIEWFTVYRQD